MSVMGKSTLKARIASWSVRKWHNFVVSVWCIYRLFGEKRLSIEDQSNSLVLSTFLGFVLLLLACYFLVYNYEERKFKSLHQDVSQENIGNYLQILLLLLIMELDKFPMVGPVLEILVYSFLTILVFLIVLRFVIVNRRILSSVVIIHLIFIYLLFSWGKNTYVKFYGVEEIGSYWSKPSFFATYYVQLSRSKSDKNMKRFPAVIQVVTETFEVEEGYEDGWGSSVNGTHKETTIFLKEIIINDDLSLEFDECLLDSGFAVRCTDYSGQHWFVQLTDKRFP